MFNSKCLSSAQISLIPQYRERWKNVALSTQRIDCRLATLAINATYAALNQPNPLIIFCTGPFVVPKILRTILRKQVDKKLKWSIAGCLTEQQLACLDEELGSPLDKQFGQLRGQLDRQLRQQLQWEVYRQLQENLRQPLEDPPYINQLWEQLERGEEIGRWHHFRQCINPDFWICDAGLLDFCTAELHCSLTNAATFLALIEHCGWIFPYKKICIVCDRPIHLAFDARGRLHAEGEFAIQFADGSGVCAYQGVWLPEQYSKTRSLQRAKNLNRL